MASAGNIFREYKDGITGGGIVGALSSGVEFKDMLKGSQAEAGLAKLEKMVLADDSSFLSSADREKLKELDDSTRRKALALLWAYLGRIDLKDAILDGGKLYIGQNGLYIDNSLIFLCRKVRGRPYCTLFE